MWYSSGVATRIQRLQTSKVSDVEYWRLANGDVGATLMKSSSSTSSAASRIAVRVSSASLSAILDVERESGDRDFATPAGNLPTGFYPTSV